MLDTNVLVSGLRSSRGAAFQVLELVGTGAFEHCVSVPLVLEYEDALNRRDMAARLPVRVVEAVLDYHCATGRQVKIHFLWRPLLRDPSDDMVLELAVAGQADAIVTFNQRDFVGVGAFGIKILSPWQLLQQLGRTPEEL